MPIDKDFKWRGRTLRIPYHEVLNNMTGLHDVESIIHRAILPDGAKAMNVRICPKTGSFIFEICHESFDIVPIGECAPEMTYNAVVQHYQVKPTTVDFIRARNNGDFK